MNPSLSSGLENSPFLIVIDPNGHRTRVPLEPFPFRIGRQPENNLVVRDSRTSRTHAQITLDNGSYLLEDAGSRHGTYVNGARIDRHVLKQADRIDFGVPDSYQLVFSVDGSDLNRLMDHFSKSDGPRAKPEVGGNLGKLRAVLEVARTLQTSYSTQDILDSVVDAALAVTGAERGFLLISTTGELNVRCARESNGKPLHESDLKVPRRVIQRALHRRRELLSMTFDPLEQDTDALEKSVADLDLRSVVCVPLLRLNVGSADATNVLSKVNDTVGVLYMDSRKIASDLSAGNRELLQTLAIEASTILENARLLEEERGKRKLEQELEVARTIQQSLLPRSLPREGWYRAAGSSEPSAEVGGDYFDVIPVNGSCWATVVADVSGKGVSSALLASLLQGVFLGVTESTSLMTEMLQRINRFLHERTDGGKYATIFHALLDESGLLRYINAGHCAPIVVPVDDAMSYLETTAMPAGLVEEAAFDVAQKRLSPGDKVVIYTDGVTEAQNAAGEFYGRRRLREVVVSKVKSSCEELHQAVQASVRAFTSGAPQSDDVTLVVVEYQPAQSALPPG